MSHDPSIEALLAHEGWARSLARALVRDSSLADDLVQRAFHVALEKPPESRIPPKRWLASVMRNLARFDARSSRNRAGIEARYARQGDDDEPADHALRVLESRALLQRALVSLEEPYRSAITERYIEELPPREIARRRGVALKTVKSQLNRGLELMRLRLDRDSRGDRSTWIAALVPLLRPTSTSPTDLFRWKHALAGALVVVPLVLVWSLWPQGAGRKPSFTAGFAGAETTKDSADSRVLSPTEASQARVALAPTNTLEIRAVDLLSRAPVGGARLQRWALSDRRVAVSEIHEWFRAGTLESETSRSGEPSRADALGRAWFPVSADRSIVTASSGSSWGWAIIDPRRSGVLEVELGEDRDIQVKVIDVDGKPLGGVRAQLYSTFGYCGEDDSVEYQFATTRESDGLATLRHAARVVGSPDSPCKASATLGIAVAGIGDFRRQLDRFDLPEQPVEFQLRQPVGTCRVRIVDEHEELFTGRVLLSVGHSGSNGFGLICCNGRASFPIELGSVVHVSAASGTTDLASASVIGPASANEVVEVILRPSSSLARVRGRLLDTGGRAVAGATCAFFVDNRGGLPFSTFRTDADGRFSLRVEAPRHEDDSPCLLHIEQLSVLSGIHASTEVALPSGAREFDAGDIRLELTPILVAGSIVDEAGQPVSDAQVVALEKSNADDWWDSGWYVTRSDEEGRFQLGQFAPTERPLAVSAHKPGHALAWLEARAGDRELRLTLRRPVLVQGAFLLDPSMTGENLLVEATPTGTPVPGYIMGYVTAGPLSSFGVESRMLERDGSFTLHELPESEYSLRLVLHEKGGPALLHVAQRVRAQRGADGVLRLPKIDVRREFRRVVVRVVDRENCPVATASVELISKVESPTWPDAGGVEFLDSWTCDADGKCMALVAEQRGTLEVSAPGFPAVEVDSHIEDVRVVLPPFPVVDIVLEGGLPVLETGLQLTASLEQDGPFRGRGRGTTERCYEHGGCFDADGRLHCATPLLGTSRVRFMIVRPGGVDRPAQFASVDDTVRREVTIEPGQRSALHVPAPDSDALMSAVARLTRPQSGR